MARRRNKRTGEVQELQNGQWVTVSQGNASPSAGIVLSPGNPLAQRKSELEVRGAEQDVAAGDREAALAPFDARTAAANAEKAEADARVAAAKAQQEGIDPQAERQKLWNARQKAQGVIETIGQARSNINDKSTGLLAKPLSFLGGTSATDLAGSLDTIKANLAFDRLQEMRDASTTGGALGSITENELKLLSSTVANIDANQSKQQLAQNLARVERHYKRFLLSLEGINPDQYKFDPFDVMKPEDARARAEAMIREGADEKTVSEFLRLQDMKFDPEQVRAGVAAGKAQVRPGEPEVGMGIQKGLEHVGSRAAVGAQEAANTVFGSDLSFGSDWDQSIQDRFNGVYTDRGGENLGRFLGVLPTALIGSPFAAGATAGALAGDSRDLQGVAGDAALGGVSGVAGDKLGRLVAGALSPKIAPNVRNLNDRGIRMTPGQILGGDARRAEGLRTTLPFAGSRIERQMDQSLDDFQFAVQDEVLAPIGQTGNRTLKPGHEGVQDTGGKVSGHYDQVLGNTSYTWSPGMGQRLLSQLGSRRMRPDVAKEVADTVQVDLGNAFAQSPRITGREWKGLDERLGATAENYRRNGMRDAATAVSDIKKQLFQDFVRQNGRQAGNIRKADRAHQRMLTYRNAATRDGAQGTATPSQLLNAAKVTAPKGRVAYSEGRAPLQGLAGDAQDTLPSQWANSRTTERSNAASPATREGMIAHAQGALVAPFYAEAPQRAFQSFMMRNPGRASEAIGNIVRAVPPGGRGMFGASVGPRILYGNDGAYDEPVSEEEYRRLASPGMFGAPR